MDEGEVIKYKNRIYIPMNDELRNTILYEMHVTLYTRYPGYHKIVIVVKKEYSWLGVKKYIVEYITGCIEC